jgi:predicted DNA-binding protein (UPF0251 family)
MSRPCKLRSVDCNPSVRGFKPCNAVAHGGEKVSLTLDELEAIRLADHEGLYQEQAAERMNVSRQTFGNIITSAHKKVADFLVNSKHLVVEGGIVEIKKCSFICGACGHTWSIRCGSEKPAECPRCKSGEFNCAKKIKQGTTLTKCWRNL